MRWLFAANVGLLATVATVAGCAPDYCNASTSELSMVGRVTDTAGSVRALVDFKVGERGMGASPWQTCDGDEVRINGRKATETVREDRVDYSLTLDADDPRRSFTFTLDRPGEGVVEASVTLAASFEIVSPVPNEMVPRSADLDIQWTPPTQGSIMGIQLIEEIGGGICLTAMDSEYDYKATAVVPDTGQWTIPAGVIVSPENRECEASFLMGRITFGDYPDELAPDGFIEGLIIRSVGFVSIE